LHFSVFFAGCITTCAPISYCGTTDRSVPRSLRENQVAKYYEEENLTLSTSECWTAVLEKAIHIVIFHHWYKHFMKTLFVALYVTLFLCLIFKWKEISFLHLKDVFVDIYKIGQTWLKRKSEHGAYFTVALIILQVYVERRCLFCFLL